jgi:16S rRNA (guanine527-N7)-methyltransferase
MYKDKLLSIVSRETIDRLDEYFELLKKWNNKINLVSNDDIEIFWERHIFDCVTLAKYIEVHDVGKNHIVDFGSGSGLPGIIIGICLEDKIIHLIESNNKKSSFLQAVLHLSKSKIYIHNNRIEEITNIQADIITARAFADISTTIKYAMMYKNIATKIYSFKGEKLEEEISNAKIKYLFNINNIYNFSNSQRTIIEINNFEHKNATTN